MASQREIWWVDVDGVHESKVRICVVTRVATDFIEVVYGQGTPGHDPQPIEVLPGTTEGDRAFRVQKATYFRAGNVALVAPVRLKRMIGMCSRTLFEQFRVLADNFHRTITGKCD